MARTDNFWNTLNGTMQTIFPSGVDILINGNNHYLNFGSASGTSGYGFRDNVGNMEYKSNGGNWAPFGSGASKNIAVGAVAPSAPTVNDLWVDTN